MSQPFDDDLRAKLRAGDERAGDLIYARYGDGLFRYIVSLVGSVRQAEDVMQDVFVDIARNRRHLAKADNIGGYLMRMARNRGIEALRRKRPEQTIERADFVEPCTAGAIISEDSQQISLALMALPFEQREAIVMKIFDDHTFADIAEIIGVSLNTIASRYRYGIEKLAIALKELQHDAR